jgi:hypothetical protein
MPLDAQTSGRTELDASPERASATAAASLRSPRNMPAEPPRAVRLGQVAATRGLAIMPLA